MDKKDHDRDLGLIRELATLFRDQDLSEMEYRRSYPDESHLKVRFVRNAGANPVPDSAPVVSHVEARTVSGSDSASITGEPGESDESHEQHPGLITSPMVGTAYLQAEPGAPPFVSAGDEVQQGQTLLIIEAMKTMNFIPSPKSGRVGRVFVENASPVEFGAPLMIIE
ncbi:MAG: acetyl-CoA carboxylase, biotin carboxyl carrier protein [Rhodobacteraceae bacterium]|nr:acetyl-CoA carboxylase, biotin carboxyl carrier protein [Paracoccaceae bacterium]MCY4138066.1 acetyl-CoA carboxylase, biotin carboxyl carrier protein [Paracoccaceae bacterium]